LLMHNAARRLRPPAQFRNPERVEFRQQRFPMFPHLAGCSLHLVKARHTAGIAGGETGGGGGRWTSFGHFSGRHSLRVTQIEGKRKLSRWLRCRGRKRPLAGSVYREARQAPGFGLVAVDRESVVAAATGMDDMVGAPAHRALIPRIVQIEDK